MSRPGVCACGGCCEVTGKRGLGDQSRNDAAHELKDIDANHASPVPLGLHGMCLKVHVAGSINKSKKEQRSRGSLVMCLSARAILSILATEHPAAY